MLKKKFVKLHLHLSTFVSFAFGDGKHSANEKLYGEKKENVKIVINALSNGCEKRKTFSHFNSFVFHVICYRSIKKWKCERSQMYCDVVFVYVCVCVSKVGTKRTGGREREKQSGWELRMAAI